MFLFEEFTNLIIGELTKGNSINLYGEVGSGKSRVLEDIEKIENESLKVINIDIGVHYSNFDGFREELKIAFHQKNIENLSSILSHIESENLNYFLLLNNFDKLLSNAKIDKDFNNKFFSFLNSMKNHSKISLLLVTKENYSDNSAIFIDSEYRTSTIHISRFFEIPNLTKDVIIKELKEINLNKTKQNEIANYILNSIESRKYQFLQKVILEFKISCKSINVKLLEKLHNEFINKNTVNISKIVKIITLLFNWLKIFKIEWLKKLFSIFKKITKG